MGGLTSCPLFGRVDSVDKLKYLLPNLRGELKDERMFLTCDILIELGCDGFYSCILCSFDVFSACRKAAVCWRGSFIRICSFLEPKGSDSCVRSPVGILVIA